MENFKNRREVSDESVAEKDKRVLVRFVSQEEKGSAIGARDEWFPTKREALSAIERAGAKPGPKMMEKGREVRIAYLPK